MMKKKIDWVHVLFWIFVAIFIIMILTRIFGHSATDIQIFVSILGIFFTGITDLYRRMGRLESNMANSFVKVKDDMKQIKDLIIKRDR